MRMTAGKFIALLFALVLVVVIVISLGYSPKARLVPLIIAFPTLALTIGQILREFGVIGQKKKGSNDSKDVLKESETNLKGYWTILFWIGLLIVMLFLIGFFPAIALFMFLYLKLQGKESWSISIIMPGCTLIVIYLAFVFGLNIDFYGGLILELVQQS